MQTLYDLVTSKQDWLKNTLVIIDPCLNPDGRDRYVNWYNQTKSTPYNPNPETREHHEPWPGGRPNHYLFDLNRDWAWATQIETQQRLKIYNKWMPQVHVDFHEQGINNPYFLHPLQNLFTKLSPTGNVIFKYKSEKIMPIILIKTDGLISQKNNSIYCILVTGTPIQRIWVPLA